MRVKTRLFPLIGSLLALHAGAVHGDVLFMKNGDRITGEIKRVWDEELFIESDYADEFAVSLDEIARIESDADFKIELRDNRTVIGRLATSASGEMILVTEESTRPITPTAIGELEQIDDYFDWSARSDLSIDANRGNTESSDFLWQAATLVKFGDHRHTLDFRFDREEQDGVTTKEQRYVKYLYSWFFSERWFLSTGATYERDPVRELNYRYTPGAGIGFQFFEDAHRLLEVSVSALGVREKLGGIKDSSTAGRWDLRYRRKILGGDLDFFHNHRFVLYLRGRTNKTVDSSTGLRWGIWGDLYLNAQVDWDWESDPAAGNEQEDITYALGVGIELD